MEFYLARTLDGNVHILKSEKVEHDGKETCCKIDERQTVVLELDDTCDERQCGEKDQ